MLAWPQRSFPIFVLAERVRGLILHVSVPSDLSFGCLEWSFNFLLFYAAVFWAVISWCIYQVPTFIRTVRTFWTIASRVSKRINLFLDCWDQELYLIILFICNCVPESASPLWWRPSTDFSVSPRQLVYGKLLAPDLIIIVKSVRAMYGTPSYQPV